MKLSSTAKIIVLFLGDVATLYASLLIALALRYGGRFFQEFTESHALPFSLVFAIWILVFYIAGLYDLLRLRNNIDFIKTLLLALLINTLLAIAVFYLVPLFGITPKTNLFLVIALFAVIEVWWRRTFNVRASFRDGLNSVLILGDDETTAEIVAELKKNAQVGYEVKLWLKRGLDEATPERLDALVKKHHINLAVFPTHAKHYDTHAKTFYELLASGIQVLDLSSFYELVFRKIPLRETDEAWFLENHIGQGKFYDDLKRGMEVISAVFLSIVLSPLLIVIAILVRITSRGPSIYRQARIGEQEKPFTLFKFRTMKADAERGGAQWAQPNDARSTPIGRFLRYAHLDELPQLANILKGDLSFVGPRPERPEFVTLLEEKVPHYKIRHLVRPGITGWAQINYRYGASVEDAEEKLQYDIYYLKNRSLILDVAIILKTIKSFFVQA
ncbi:MAG: hypothetical protein A2122_00685 [Candidatus Liptonbacteria bacterium GWB1_49_6]|uniref:Bacterial sugar transferase domain-containing protein n=1 Tax=Candidatus Liptonbacteria bacterium GWB1_49_6 TaxID=1798644 RepID=A0A1G2C6N0_9BACT|nr:MAG: hypothetical protein A2122_00685 [Candidatus Liptonbacteria bacterium GWB1_49_6]